MRAVPLAADSTPAVITAPRARLSGIPWTLFWVSAGAINFLLGARVALGPAGSKDLLLVRQWASAALIDGVNPYRTTIPADYAPWSLLAVSPVLCVPASWLPALWVALNAALGFLVARLAFTALAVNQPPPLARAVGLLFAWAAVRIGLGNGQFVLLALASGLASVCLARRGAMWSGPLLALALIKPQLGLAFVVWAGLERRFKTLLVGLATVAAAVVVFALRVHDLPTRVFADYLGVVNWELGSRFVRGTTDIRPLLDDFTGNREAAWLVTVAYAGAALAIIAVVVSRTSDSAAPRVSLPLACLWTLTSTFHNTYDLVLLWPVWVALWQLHQTGSGCGTLVLGVVQAALVLGVPGLWWKFSHRAADAQGVVGAAAVHFDRLLVLAVLVYFVVDHRRRQ